MIKPHGADALTALYVADENARQQLETEAASLPSIVVSSAAAANAVMLGGGYFTPLPGYQNLADALSIAEHMHTTDGVFWPVPILNLCDDVSAIEGAKRIALRDPNVDGNPILAVMDVEAIEKASDEQIDLIAEKVFGTLDDAHPGVGVFRNQGRFVVSGPIQVLNFSYFERDFPGTFQTATEIRSQIEARGWNRVVAFQTRNPMHLAHEELCRMGHAAARCRRSRHPHAARQNSRRVIFRRAVRDACIRKMVDEYFPENSVIVNGYGFDMLYAGPREAVLHAVFRQKHGCNASHRRPRSCRRR